MVKNKKKNYKLVRYLTTAVVITSIATAISTCTAPKYIEDIPFTQEDTINNLTFSEELKTILEDTEISFKNKELYEIVCSQVDGELTVAKLREITSLEITNTLENSDLSDLKYLTNLHYLRIDNNPVDFENIKYNQDLFLLTVNECTIKNTSCIPNSTDSLFIQNCVCEDQSIIVPYYTTNLHIFDTDTNNLILKNPSCLECFSMVGDGYIDLQKFTECINLKELEIKLCANIKNASSLRQLTNLEKVTFDDYAAIWLDTDTLLSLPIEEDFKYILYDEISKIDEIAKSLTNNEELTESEKIANISSYILSSLAYNYDITSEEEKNKKEIADYNLNPINYTLTKDEVICINYASFFTALANRLDLDSYQLFSEDHTWNIAKTNDTYNGYDLTYLESGPIIEMDDGTLAIIADTKSEEIIDLGKGDILYYYEFNLDEYLDDEHNADLTPMKINDAIQNIGYINEDSLIKVINKTSVKYYKLTSFLKVQLCLMLLALGIEMFSENKKQKRLIKYEEENN